MRVGVSFGELQQSVVVEAQRLQLILARDSDQRRPITSESFVGLQIRWMAFFCVWSWMSVIGRRCIISGYLMRTTYSLQWLVVGMGGIFGGLVECQQLLRTEILCRLQNGSPSFFFCLCVRVLVVSVCICIYNQT